MNIIPGLDAIISDYTLQIVALGAAILGIVSGALGCFAVLRKQSLIGDAISHAALPGIVLAFIIFRDKTPLVLMAGATLLGWLGMVLVSAIVRNTRIKPDSALGLVLSVFFGFGLLLLTFVQRFPDARQAGLDRFLFGQAATMLESDVILMSVLGGIAIILMGIFWKELKLLSFDMEFGASLGFPMRALDTLLMSLLVVSIVIGLQSVGVVLMSAMVVAPAAAARQWTDRLSWMVILAAFFGAISGIAGALISSLLPRLSTGPTIVLCISMIVVISLIFAPKRGLLWNWLRNRQILGSQSYERVLAILLTLSRQHEDPQHPHSISVMGMMGLTKASLQRTLRVFNSRGWVGEIAGEGWYLTPEGMAEAQKARNIKQEEKVLQNDIHTN